jgi:hypothetical protein
MKITIYHQKWWHHCGQCVSNISANYEDVSFIQGIVVKQSLNNREEECGSAQIVL